MITASIITTCKGRREHLIETIDFMTAQKYKGYEVIVVDYGDPDKVHEYVRSHVEFKNKVTICVLKDTEVFNLNRARNYGARYARGGVLAFVDADVFIPCDWLGHVVSKIKKGNVLVVRDKNKEGITGTFAVTKEVFSKVNGFDEAIRGWGHDEVDFFKRCAKYGTRCVYDPRMVHAIKHTDELRTTYYEEKDKKISLEQNMRLSAAKDRVVNPHGYAVGEVLYCRYPETPYVA